MRGFVGSFCMLFVTFVGMLFEVLLWVFPDRYAAILLPVTVLPVLVPTVARSGAALATPATAVFSLVSALYLLYTGSASSGTCCARRIPSWSSW